jgi:hypothetical protein
MIHDLRLQDLEDIGMKADKEQIFNYIMEQNKTLINCPIGCLRDWLNKCRLSVTDFCLILGVSRSFMHRLMSGTRKPSIQMMDHIRAITNGKIRDEEDLRDTF